MSNSEFLKLVEDSKSWLKSTRELGYNFDSILADMYNEPTHFIYELLQNAEDVGATEVSFKLYDNKLEIHHNGRDFNFKDVKGISGIGITTKKNDINQIGKFGVGFKSVFAITKTPYIYSGEYHIKIEDYVVPSEVDSEYSSGTTIILPFNHDKRSKEEVFKLVDKKLVNIGLETLLFLTHIKKIQWETASTNGQYSKNYNREDVQEGLNLKRVQLEVSNNTKDYLLIERPLNKELGVGETAKILSIGVAYKLAKDNKGKEIIISEPDSKLNVFFPTEIDTFLNFRIQGPYRTTPSRETIPFDNEQNKIIIQETGKLISESLLLIKNLGFLDINFLTILPVVEGHKDSKIYTAVYEKVKEKFLSGDELLPNKDGQYTNTNRAILARGKELTELLNEEDTQKLFNKGNWLDTNITQDRTKDLRDYIVDKLDILEITPEKFANKISAEFLERKSDEWIVKFYSWLLNQQYLWRSNSNPPGILINKPIIRLEDSKHVAPLNSQGEIQVYLPSEIQSQYKTVKRILAESKDSLEFLKELGLKKPDLFAEIKMFIIPKYKIKNGLKTEGYFEDFEKLLIGYETIPSDKKSNFTNQLYALNFIDSVNDLKGIHELHKPSDVYIRTADLTEYFHNSTSAFFVSDELYKKLDNKRLSTFLTNLGVQDKPRRIEKNADLSDKEKVILRGNENHTRDIIERDYEYEGLGNFLNQMSANKSYLLWRLLLKNIANKNEFEARDFFKGNYIWFYRSEHNKKFDAQFIKLLKSQQWLVDKKGKFQRPEDITLGELADDYTKVASNLNILTEALGITNSTDDITKQLPPEDRKKLELTKGYSSEQLKEILENSKASISQDETNKDNQVEWNPEYDPDKVNPMIETINPEKIVPQNLKGQSEELISKTKENKVNGENKSKDDSVDVLSYAQKTAIGDWGEKYVYHTLKERYKRFGSIVETEFGFKTNKGIEVIWLNKKGNVGKGYDFTIKGNGIELKYIEVKSTTTEASELIEITGIQWEFARQLYDNNEGGKYFIYVVPNTGKGNAKIIELQDPIKLWKEGKLYAHPVHFKLPPANKK